MHSYVANFGSRDPAPVEPSPLGICWMNASILHCIHHLSLATIHNMPLIADGDQRH